jgi:hypothetical protein
MRSEQTPAAEPEKPDAGPPVEVDVARTGGFAGITRRWTAQPPEDEASEWISLIDRCPWDETPAPQPAPRSSRTHAPVADGAVTGAWRELVDAVREWSRSSPGPERPGR